MQIVLLIFNVFAYLVVIATGVVLADPYFNGNEIRDSFNGIAALCRDFVLGLIFIIFVITLRIGLKEDLLAGETVDERKLVYFTIILSVFLLLRGGVSLVQGFAFTDEAKECQSAFLSVIMICELLFEGLPLIFLIRVNNDFLASQTEHIQEPRKMSMGGSMVDDSFT
jgi:hypothetical protein